MVTLVVDPTRFGGVGLEVMGDDYRHLFRSLRLRVGDRLRVVDGFGSARFSRVEAVDRRRAELSLAGPAPAGEPARRVEVAVAAIRPERAGWAVEKVTEVGAAAIHWFGCERAPRRYGAGQLERFRRIATSAVSQSGRSLVPPVDTLAWRQLLELASELDTALLDPAAAATLAGAGRQLVVVGPEGGLTDDETRALTGLGAIRYKVGETTLRTETAAVVACALSLCQ